MHSANGALELTEKRSAVEMLGFQEAARREGLQVRWTHGEANLADSLTKPTCMAQLETCAKLGYRWRLVHDPLMRAARERKQAGAACQGKRV
eukprot:10171983-Alexandrium_andersonii.AAC.1